MEFYLTAIMLGLCLSAMALGIFITMKIFSIPDITTDGSYTLGAVLTAVLLTANWPAWLVIPVVMFTGAIAGSLTGLIHTKLKIDALFSYLHPFANITYNEALTVVIFIALLCGILGYLLRTDFGIAMRAVGNSASMTRALGINNDVMKIIGLAMANAFTALSGYLVAQYQNFTDINMGIGIVITGLGSVLIGDALIKWWGIRGISVQLIIVLTGSIIFQLVLAFTLSAGIDPNLLKLVTSVMVLLIVSIPRIRNRKA
jgi:putative tryptophan/tyrosine transport system permease protein